MRQNSKLYPGLHFERLRPALRRPAPRRQRILARKRPVRGSAADLFSLGSIPHSLAFRLVSVTRSEFGVLMSTLA